MAADGETGEPAYAISAKVVESKLQSLWYAWNTLLVEIKAFCKNAMKLRICL